MAKYRCHGDRENIIEILLWFCSILTRGSLYWYYFPLNFDYKYGIRMYSRSSGPMKSNSVHFLNDAELSGGPPGFCVGNGIKSFLYVEASIATPAVFLMIY